MKTTPKIPTDELIQKVIEWGNEKGITGPCGSGTVHKQLEKTQEELTETRDAMWKLMLSNPATRDHYSLHEEVMDGIGDMMVTIILAADLAGFTINECIKFAYDEIAGRTGQMVNGMFIKDGRVVTERSITEDDDIEWGDLCITEACTLGDETCESCQ